MAKKMISRREFLRVSVIATAGAAAAACAKAAPEEPTATAEAAVPTPTEAAAPTPTPEPAVDTGRQAPMLAALVVAGELPPIDERLPEDPMVVVPTYEIGQYGGTLNSFMVNAEDRSAVFNFCLDYPLVDVPRDLARFGEERPQGGWEGLLVRAYEWSADATELTLHLRKGLRWSDGEPCMAEDFLWYYRDEIFDENLTPVPPSWLIIDGEQVTISAPDDYTLLYEFPAANPGFLYRIRFTWHLVHRPKHFFESFHPKYNQDATYEGYQEAVNDWLLPDRPNASAWIVESRTPEAVICARNAYYFATDTEGNQLPYVDRVAFPMVGTTDNAVLKTMAGEIDVAERNMQQIDQLPILLENEEAGDYKILMWSGTFFGVGTTLTFNPQLQDPEYPELREMLRDTRFRRALNVAVDREDMNESIFLGLGRPAMWALNSSSPYFDDEMAEIVKPIYDPEEAKSLLDALDLIDRNSDGKRQYPNGKTVTILVDAASELKPHVLNGEMIVRYWNEIGLDARLNTVSRSLVSDRFSQHISQARIWGPFNADIPEWTSEEVFCPVYVHSSRRVEGDTMPEWATVLDDYLDRILASVGNFEETKRLYKEYAQWRIENGIGFNSVADVPYMVVGSNRMGNVAEKGSGLLGIRIENQEQFYIYPEKQ
jgi:peptide/nickel transport system substrate-binding protein